MDEQLKHTDVIEIAGEIPLSKSILLIALYNYILAAGYAIISINIEDYILFSILGSAAWVIGSILKG